MRADIGSNPTGWKHAWCGRYLSMLTGRNINRAIDWLHEGFPAPAGAVGSIAVARHHVGVVTGICDATHIKIVSGSFNGVVDEGCYPKSKIVAWRWLGRPVSIMPQPRPAMVCRGQPAGISRLASEIKPLPLRPSDEKHIVKLDEARRYLVHTATPGGTMTRQGAELAIRRLNPEFATRLAHAIKKARAAGIEDVGVFSAYRPPSYGVGGFKNKFCSLHSYGLAVDMAGIGGAGSRTARKWHRIAFSVGVIGPYGPNNRAEFNHMQPTWTRSMCSKPIRKTITAHGPRSLEKMWRAGNRFIASIGGKDSHRHARHRHRHSRVAVR